MLRKAVSFSSTKKTARINLKRSSRLFFSASHHLLFSSAQKKEYLEQQLKQFSFIAIDDYPKAVTQLTNLLAYDISLLSPHSKRTQGTLYIASDVNGLIYKLLNFDGRKYSGIIPWIDLPIACQTNLPEIMRYKNDYINILMKKVFQSYNAATVRFSKHEINLKHNELCASNETYKNNLELAIQEHFKRTTPHIKKIALSPNNTAIPIFRSVSLSWVDLDSLQHHAGLAAPLVDVRGGGKPFYSPEIVTYQVDEHAKAVHYNKKHGETPRFDMAGFVFGPLLCTSSNIAHVLGERFELAECRQTEDRVILMMAATEGYCATQGIFHGAGYVRDRKNGLKGKEGTSCQEHSREVVPGCHVDYKNIVGYRIAYQGGHLGEFVMNSAADKALFDKMQTFLDVQCFLQANNVQEILEWELLLSDNPLQKVEEAQKIAIQLSAKDADLQKKIVTEAKYRNYPDALPLSQEDEMRCSSAYFKQHGFVHALKGKLIAKELHNSNQFLDEFKAPSKEALQERALNAYLEQKEEFTTVREVKFTMGKLK